MKHILVFFMLIISATTFAQSKKSILFIGNSYTAVNNLPQMVHDVAMSTNDTLVFDSNTPGGYTFQMQSTNATTIQKINQQKWDYVVLQEQSQIPSFPPSQVATDCYPYAKRLDSMIRANDSCTQVIFYMTWGRKYGDASNCASYPPLCTYAGMQQRLRESYMEMADSNWAWTAPVGAAFRNARIADSTINLYQSDYSHPSAAGGYLAACVFYARIYKKNPVGISFISTLTPTVASFLQSMAKLTVLDSITLWNEGKYPLPASCASGQVPQGLRSLTFTDLLIYPNPVADYLEFGNHNSINSTVCITDNLGKVRLTEKVQNGTTKISIVSLPPGVYHCRITNQIGSVTKRFIKL